MVILCIIPGDYISVVTLAIKLGKNKTIKVFSQPLDRGEAISVSLLNLNNELCMQLRISYFPGYFEFVPRKTNWAVQCMTKRQSFIITLCHKHQLNQLVQLIKY